MQSNTFIARGALALVMYSTGWVFAASDYSELGVPQAPHEASAASVTQAGPDMVAGFGVPLMRGRLEDHRGGFDLVNNNMQLSGTVADNSAVRVMSGNNSIADGAFTNASGFPIVIQNSGSNVLIQNATIINVQMQ